MLALVAPACSIVVNNALDGNGGGSAGGSAGGTGGGSAGGAAGGSAGGSGGGSAGGSAGGSGGGSAGGGSGGGACDVPVVDGTTGGATSFSNISAVTFHSAALPFGSGEPILSSIAFIASGQEWILLGDSDGGVTAYPVNGGSVTPTQLAVGPGRMVGGKPCATLLGFSQGGSFLAEPASCRSSGNVAYFVDGGFPAGIALGGHTEGTQDPGYETTGTNLIAFGTNATVCGDVAFPTCSPTANGVGPFNHSAIPAVDHTGARSLESVVATDGTTHWILSSSSSGDAGIADLSSPTPGPTGYIPGPAPISAAVASSSLVGDLYIAAFVQMVPLTASPPPCSIESAIFAFNVGSNSLAYIQSVSNFIDDVPDNKLLHSLLVGADTTADTIRSAWTVQGEVYYSDISIPLEHPERPERIGPPAIPDACNTGNSGIKFVAPLNSRLLFTVDLNNNVHIHTVQ